MTFDDNDVDQQNIGNADVIMPSAAQSNDMVATVDSRRGRRTMDEGNGANDKHRQIISLFEGMSERLKILEKMIRNKNSTLTDNDDDDDDSGHCQKKRRHQDNTKGNNVPKGFIYTGNNKWQNKARQC